MTDEELEQWLREYPETLREEDDYKLGEKARQYLREHPIKIKSKQPRRSLYWKLSVVTCVLLAIIITPLAVFLPQRTTEEGERPPAYFASDQLTSESYPSIVHYNQENNKKLLNLSIYGVNLKCDRKLIIDTNETAYFEEVLILESDEKYEEITFQAVPSKNQFEFFNKYEGLTETKTVSGIDVVYNVTVEDEILYLLKFKFTYQGAQYFVDMISTDPDCLQHTMDKLLASVS